VGSNLYVSFLAALIAVLNPVGNLPMFITATAGYRPGVRRFLALLVGVVVGISMLIFLFAGNAILRFFGISLPAFQIAGGVLLLHLGLRMVTGEPSMGGVAATHVAPLPSDFGEARLRLKDVIVPVAIPMFVGPGTLSTIVLFAARAHDARQLAGLSAVLVVASGLTVVALMASTAIARYLRESGLQISTRILGLIITAMAIQFMLTGMSRVVTFINPAALTA
jgi:multiple antibiotic resistance protein